MQGDDYMKIVVSDLTDFLSFDKIERNVEAINDFVKKGNLFILATNKAMNYLEQIAPENIVLVRAFSNSGIKLENAFQTHAVLYMYKHYCRRRRCLECRIYCFLSKRDAI